METMVTPDHGQRYNAVLLPLTEQLCIVYHVILFISLISMACITQAGAAAEGSSLFPDQAQIAPLTAGIAAADDADALLLADDLQERYPALLPEAIVVSQAGPALLGDGWCARSRDHFAYV